MKIPQGFQCALDIGNYCPGSLQNPFYQIVSAATETHPRRTLSIIRGTFSHIQRKLPPKWVNQKEL